MKKEFEVIDKEGGYKVLGVYMDSDLKDYPFHFFSSKDNEDTYLTSDEAHDLYLFLEDIFGPKILINE